VLNESEKVKRSSDEDAATASDSITFELNRIFFGDKPTGIPSKILILLILLLMEVWGEHRGARNARPPDRSERSVDAVMLMSLHKLCSRSNND
jgi:hypothetical protein